MSYLRCAGILVLWLLMTDGAKADISFAGQTRFIMPAGSTRKTIKIVNNAERISLVKVSVDWGAGGQGDPPLALTQPLVAIEPKSERGIDLIYQGVGLPEDRESYFLISVLEVPEAPSQESVLQITPRHRMKLFYRPAFAMTINDAFSAVKWSMQGDRNGSLVLDNPSPYYITLSDASFLNHDGEKCGAPVEHAMAAPFSGARLHYTGCGDAPAGVEYSLISDFGIPQPYVVYLSTGSSNAAVPCTDDCSGILRRKILDSSK